MKLSRWLLVILSILLILFAGFSIWAYTPLGPMPEALAAMESDDSVQVINDRWFMFLPVQDSRDTGLIFYPGGRVDPRSYAPIAQRLASEGFPVVIVPMPFNLAVFGASRAGEVIETFPEIKNWAIAGHSLGGSMAARYFYQSTNTLQGLVFWASYPAASDDLSQSSKMIVSIFGTQDGLTSLQDIDNSRDLLPESTSWVPIDGGNHAQFGWYGEQPGDNPARISREQQQDIIFDATIEVLQELDQQ